MRTVDRSYDLFGRTASLLRAPIVDETERLHFQRRLSFTLLLVFFLAFGFWVITAGIHPLLGRGSIGVLFTRPRAIVQLATTATALAGSLLVRWGKRSVTFLDVADIVIVLVVCWGWDYMATRDDGIRRSELIGILAVSYTLVSRAALVPSTTLRTAVLGVASFLPLVPATHAMYAASNAPELLDAERSLPLAPAVYVAIWSAVGVVCTSTISYVSYGLRLQVRKATRLGQYFLEAKIGEGGTGVVYRASHAMLRRPTAIKLLTGTTGQSAERFEREVQLTAGLTHPNTIAVFDYGRTPEGVFYYAMEYLDGITLDDLVRDYGPQPPARVVHLLVQVCGALEEAHAAGLVHRDIKPANMMLTERGGVKDVVKVLDFGLVKEPQTSKSLATSSTNAVKGTPHFMAPEAIVDPEAVDARTDIYSLGVTAYFLLTGERVFDGANLVEICSAQLHQTPVPPSDMQPTIPKALEQIVLDCLEKNPQNRPTSATRLIERLLACDLPPWSREDARRWWENATPSGGLTKTSADARARRASSNVHRRTVTIDFGDRSSH
ncbi:MAG TPA: serine/threonine-protein kinase [Labilithrix sp.]|nr:serine/threonine-protein kinase [Labilithrix sp.]